MPEDVNLNIDLKKTGEGDKEAAAGLKVVARAADDAKDELAALDRKLIETRAALLAAGKAFSQTGDISPFKSLLKDERQLGQVSKTLKRLTDDVAKDVVKTAEQTGPSFARGLLNSVSGGTKGIGPLSSGMSSALIYGAVAAAPAIAATVNAAVLGAVGGGVLAGGIVVASKDSRVRAAWSEFGKAGSDALTAQSDVLVQPLVHAADTLRASLVSDVIPTFGAGLDRLAPSIDHISTGLAGFAHNIGPGLLDGLTGSEKVLSELGDDLPRMGSAAGYAMRELSKGAEGAKDAVSDVVTVVDGVTRAAGFAIGKLSQLYELSHNIPGLGGAVQDLTALSQRQGEVHKSFQYLQTDAGISAQALEGLSASAAKAGLGARLSAQDFSIFTNALSQTKLTTDQLAGAMTDKLLNSALSLDRANLGTAESLSRVSEAFKENGRSLDIATAKGQANREAVLAAVSANIQQYDSLIQAHAGADVAAAAYDANTAALDRQLHKAGLTQAQIDGLIGKYRNVPDKVDTNIAILGLTKAIENLTDLEAQINHVATTHYGTVIITEQYRTSSPYAPGGSVYRSQVPGAQALGGIVAAARGMIASAPSVVFGERTLPEAYIPARNSGISQARADALLSTAGSWWGRRLVPSAGGGGATNITVNVYAGWGTNGAEVGQQILDVLRSEIKSRGGNVQMILSGRPAQ